MGLSITLCQPEHVPLLRSLNSRIRSTDMEFPEEHDSSWLPREPREPIWQEYFVALDDDGEARGAYMLKYQPFLLRGESTMVADYQLPVSEGIVDRRYATVGVQLYMHAARQQPRLYGLGVGSLEQPIAKMFAGLKWSHTRVPFYFRVENGFRFLRNIQPLRRSATRRMASDLLAFTGVGMAGIAADRWWRGEVRTSRDIAAEEVSEFGSWADAIWESCHRDYQLIALRDRTTLERLYPEVRTNPGRFSGPEPSPFIRLLVRRQGEPIGWAVLLATPMKGHKYFGNLTVGTLVDCLSRPEDAPHVVAAARDALRDRRVDLMISNQAHEAWGNALAAAGFRTGPSNFYFFASPALAAGFQPFDAHRPHFHLNRGDGDGPINL